MKQLKDFFLLYKQYAWEKDIENMIGLYDENVVIFDLWEHGNQKGLPDWSDMICDWLNPLEQEKVNVIFELIEIHSEGNIGFASAVVHYEAISNENTVVRSMKNRITLGFIKNKGAWKVVHQHTSAPINSDLKAILNF